MTDWSSTQGYNSTRYDNEEQESKIVSLTSPGFHSLSMDDRMENCRMRMRTTSGHQILLDDTNERIYIATAKGNNWIEMDQDGNIDIYTANKLNVRAASDINFTSDETIRFTAKKGIHMVSQDEIRMQGAKDIHIQTQQNLRVGTEASLFLSSEQAVHVVANTTVNMQSGSTMNLRSGGEFNATASDTINMNSSGDYLVTAETIHHNGPTAAVADAASPAADKPAFWTNRVPTHEPYARTMTKDDFTHEPEVSYTSDLVNRFERGRNIIRGFFWRR